MFCAKRFFTFCTLEKFNFYFARCFSPIWFSVINFISSTYKKPKLCKRYNSLTKCIVWDDIIYLCKHQTCITYVKQKNLFNIESVFTGESVLKLSSIKTNDPINTVCYCTIKKQ